LYVCCFNMIRGDVYHIGLKRNREVLIDFIFISENKKGQQMLANVKDLFFNFEIIKKYWASVTRLI
ncbi:hypothetical protein, partial [Photorhabdus aegyptia]|uniref:hypothetical protein n=1 Tax=Photorhabdus aegyptia TaxID=2805098 RepID=UPI001E5D1FFB